MGKIDRVGLSKMNLPTRGIYKPWPTFCLQTFLFHGSHVIDEASEEPASLAVLPQHGHLLCSPEVRSPGLEESVGLFFFQFYLLWVSAIWLSGLAIIHFPRCSHKNPAGPCLQSTLGALGRTENRSRDTWARFRPGAPWEIPFVANIQSPQGAASAGSSGRGPFEKYRCRDGYQISLSEFSLPWIFSSPEANFLFFLG